MSDHTAPAPFHDDSAAAKRPDDRPDCEGLESGDAINLEIADGLSEMQSAKIAKALADPQRFAILCSISEQDEFPCKELVAQFPITQATISHHLKELVAAGLITSRRQGQMAILSCRRDVCRAYTEMLTRRLAH